MELRQALSPVEDAVAAIARGGMAIVVDDPGRENEGDLIVAAEYATPEAINFMVTHGRGLVCTPMLPDRIDALGLGPMSGSRYGRETSCAFTQSIDLRNGGTGISAAERAACIRRAADPSSTRLEFSSPGHVFPLIAQPGGVLERAGHTEATIDLARLAGLQPAGVCCEILNDDGTMARMPQLVAFAERHGLSIVSIADLIAYRLRTEAVVRRTADATLPTEFGTFRTVLYDTREGEAVAMVMGEPSGRHGVPIVLHRECVLGDALGAAACDCGAQLHHGMARVAAECSGIVVYLRGSGSGLTHGLAHALHAATPTSERDLAVAAGILRDLGPRSMRLVGSSRRVDLAAYGIPVVPEEFELAAVASEW